MGHKKRGYNLDWEWAVFIMGNITGMIALYIINLLIGVFP